MREREGLESQESVSKVGTQFVSMYLLPSWEVNITVGKK